VDESVHQKRPASSNNQPIWVIAIFLFLGLLVCMLVGYTAYIGSIVLLVQRSSGDATATSIKEAQIATSTAEAHATTLTEFGLVDKFDSNQNGWKVGKENNQFWIGEISIGNGVYKWDVQELKGGFLNYSNFSNSPIMDDFDVSVDVTVVNGTYGSCSGMLFREAPSGWEYGGGYAISVCNDGQFFMGYVDAEGKWLTSSGWVTSEAIHTSGWNRIEINARGSRFIAKINDFVVYEMSDTHRARGNVALFIEMHEGDENSRQTGLMFADEIVFSLSEKDDTVSAIFLFDNFGLQGR
jgi:hypothetical protein